MFMCLLLWFSLVQQTDVYRETSVNSYCTLPATDPFRDQLVNIVEHFAAKEPEVSHRSWWRPKPELKEEGVLDLDSTGGIRDQIQMRDHAAL